MSETKCLTTNAIFYYLQHPLPKKWDYVNILFEVVLPCLERGIPRSCDFIRYGYNSYLSWEIQSWILKRDMPEEWWILGRLGINRKCTVFINITKMKMRQREGSIRVKVRSHVACAACQGGASSHKRGGREVKAWQRRRPLVHKEAIGSDEGERAWQKSSWQKVEG